MTTVLKNLFQTKTTKISVLMAAMMVMAIGAASAEEPTASGDWKAIITDNITSLASDILVVLGVVLAAALGIFALQFGVRKAIKFFKSSTN